jgi:hypothetical protein
MSYTSGEAGLRTIALAEAKDLGGKCDEDEFTAMKTGTPFVDGGKDEWDITVPLRDVSGKMIGAPGMDSKVKPGQQRSAVVRLASEITGEIEKQIPSSARLFEPENQCHADSLRSLLRRREFSGLPSTFSFGRKP